MTELAVLTILAGVLAVGITLAAVTLAALHRLENRIEERFDHIERRFDQFAERGAKLEVEQARINGQLDASRAPLFDRAPASIPE